MIRMLKTENFSDRELTVFLLLTALVLRVIYAIVYFCTTPSPVTNAYYEIAVQILDQGRILYDTDSPYYESVGPLLPWINAFTMLVTGRNYLGLYIVTALISSLVTVYTYKLARLFTDKKVALFIGIWSAFYLFYFYFTPTPGKDIWMSFFLIFLIYNLIVLFRFGSFSWTRFLTFTFLFVLSFHLDERFIVFTPFIFLYILYYEISSSGKFRVGEALIFAILVIVLMIPWTIRNYNKHNKIVLLSTRTESFTDKILGYEPGEHIIDRYTDIHGVYYLHDYQIDSVINGLKTTTDEGVKITPGMIKALIKGKRPAPLTGMKAAGSRLVTMFEPFQIRGRFERTGYFYYKKSFRHNIATFLFYGILFIFSFPGFYFLYKRDRHTATLFISVIIIYALIHALAIPYTNWRYRLPLDSLFIIAGCSGMAQIWSIIRNRNLNADKE
ncbi:MAG: glycosyltransferase family 39 protein [Bacteroidales bacterium]|nr:glycosyltransferase family 39 protein [Bacteroidales bacterium]